MSSPAATLENEQRRHVVQFSSAGSAPIAPKITFAKNSAGADILQVSDLPVFRSGTFRDSWGIQHTWEPIHMEDMVRNFDYLRSKGTFAQVPVKRGHGSLFGEPMDNLIGWHTGLTSAEMKSPVDGQPYTYLVASFDVFDQSAMQHIAAGNWPNKSSEIGTYVNNEEAEYFPAYFGFAYVDIPAVEGLNFARFAKADTRFSILVPDVKEFGVSAPAGGTATQSTTLPDPLAAPAAPAAPVAPPAAPAAPAADAPHAAPAAPHTFTIGGRPTADFGEVQRHIGLLEEFQSETVKSGRTAFVSSLAEGDAPKIAASQVPDLTELALGLSDEQFSKFQSSYTAAPANPLFGQYSAGNASPADNTPAAPPNSPSGADQRKTDLEEIVARHKASGMNEAALHKTKSWVELQTLIAASATK